MTEITKIRVRYAETDNMGVVYYANYFIWMEIGRTELLRSIGIRYRDLEEKGYLLPVVKAFARYISPGFYDDEISIHSTVTKLSGPRIRIDYKMFREEKELICKGFTEHAFLSKETKKIIKPPENLTKNVVIPNNADEFITKI
jgi:acyl-CoA thioester hydrolase